MPAAVLLGLALYVVSMTVQVPTVRAATSPLDAQASELVRLMNGARKAAGKAPLVVDTNLASKARDGAIPCPDDAAKTISGRAQDFAAFNTSSHDLRLCDSATYALSTTAFVSTMQTAWGYGSVGEIIGVNSGYGNGAYLWQYIVSGKVLWQTWTYATTGHIMGSATTGWQSSSTHWGIIMGAYDRVGCGGWASGASYYYDCVFARGGAYPTRAAPASSPFSNPLPTPVPTGPPTPAPTARPVAPTSKPVSGGGASSGGGTAATHAPTQAPTATPTIAPPAAPTDAPTAAPTLLAAGIRVADATGTPALVAALQQSRNDMLPSSRTTGFAGGMLQLLAAAAASVLAMLAAFLVILSLRRRRRETAP
jgi:cell division septation protein DedD